MTTDALLGQMRYLIGQPSQNEVPDRDLLSFLRPSLVWLASELEMEVFTDNQIAMVADQAEYPLPRGLSWVIWVEVNKLILEATSTYELNLFHGNWRTVPSGQPTKYAVEGRNLILNPAPSAGVIANIPTFAWRYIGTGEEYTQSGTPELSDMDQEMVRYDAAIGWLAAHPTADNQQRIANYKEEIKRRLPACIQRWENALKGFYPHLSPETHGRLYGAR